MAIVCDQCTHDRECAMCLENTIACLTGTARSRGFYWARRVAMKDRRFLEKEWPETPKSLAIAARQVRDLARDPRARETLTRKAQAEAIRTWKMLREETPVRRDQLLTPERKKR